VKGLAGGIYSGVPGLAPALEAAGELSDTLVPGQDPRFNIVPRPGQIHRAMAESPQGLEASAAIGASVPLAGQASAAKSAFNATKAAFAGKAAPQVGRAVGAFQQGSQAALAPAARVFENLAGRQAPGLLRTGAAGTGTGMSIGAAEAGIRRLPAAEQAIGQAVHGQDVTAEVPQVDVANEILAPGAMGGISSILPGMSSWASNPRTIRGQRATTFARDKASGAHEQEPMRSLMEGQEGIEQAKEIANRNYQDQFPQLEQPVRAAERRQVGALERDLNSFKGEATMAKGQAAAEIEPQVLSRLQGQRKGTSEELHSTLKQLDDEGVTLPPTGLKEVLRGIVEQQASSTTAGTRTESKTPSGLVDAQGKPVMMATEGAPGSGEVHTPYGETLARVEALAARYLPEKATVGDYRNFLKYVKAMAESGTAEKTFPFKEIVGAVREHIGKIDPRMAEANARYREATTQQERTRGIVYKNDEIQGIGQDSAHGRIDVPEADDGPTTYALTPGEEATGRQRLMQLGDKSPAAAARIPQREELIKNGYGAEVEAMESRLRDIEQMTYETQQKHDDAVAAVKAEVAQQLRDISRELIPQTDAILESKVAQEASKFRFGKLVRPLTEAALGAASHSPAYAGARGADAATKIGDRIAQPLASAISSRLPDAADLRSTIPGMMGVATPREGAQAATKDMVEQARKQKERFKDATGSVVGRVKRFGATIFERQQAKQ
jgi:hypothetical protein